MFSLRTRLLGAALLLGANSAALAQQPTLLVTAPRTTYELYSSFSFDITGSNIYSPTPQITVFADDTDITSTVTVGTESEYRENSSVSGVVASYSGSFSVDLNGYHANPGQLFRVVALAGSPQGNASAQSATEVLSHVQVWVNDTVPAGSTAVHIAVEVSEIRLQSQAIVVRLNGSDVTSQVSITGPDLAAESVESGTPVYVRDRIQRYWVNISSLGSGISGRLTFAVTATNSSSATTSGTAAGSISPAGNLTDCQKDAVKALCDSLGLSKTNGKTSIGASASTVKTAIDTCQQALAECGGSVPAGTPYTYTSGGVTYTVLIGAGTPNSSVSGNADLVIAIGADGSGNGAGGNATAVNTKPGGAALAVGGDGGSGATSAGNGGNGTATAAGLPPDGGNGFGIGGNGGQPSPNSNAGGNGGTGKGTVGGGGNSNTGSGTNGAGGTGGGAGTYGGGGWGNSYFGNGSSGHNNGGNNH